MAYPTTGRDLASIKAEALKFGEFTDASIAVLCKGQSPDQFLGWWDTNNKASDSLDPILHQIGIGKMKTMMMKGFNPRTQIEKLDSSSDNIITKLMFKNHLPMGVVKENPMPLNASFFHVDDTDTGAKWENFAFYDSETGLLIQKRFSTDRGVLYDIRAVIPTNNGETAKTAITSGKSVGDVNKWDESNRTLLFRWVLISKDGKTKTVVNRFLETKKN